MPVVEFDTCPVCPGSKPKNNKYCSAKCYKESLGIPEAMSVLDIHATIPETNI